MRFDGFHFVAPQVTLDRRWLAKSFSDAIVVPFLSIYNKKQFVPVKPADLTEILIDGVKALPLG